MSDIADARTTEMTPNYQWNQSFGNISQMISAVSAIVFGISTLVISRDISGIQKFVSEETSKASEMALLQRYADDFDNLDDFTDPGMSCLQIIGANMKKEPNLEISDPIRFKADKRDWLAALDNSEEEKSDLLESCKKIGGPLQGSHRFLLRSDNALRSYDSKLSPGRKNAYYEILGPMFCDSKEAPQYIFTSDHLLTSKFIEHYPNIAEFMLDCESAKAHALARSKQVRPKPVGGK